MSKLSDLFIQLATSGVPVMQQLQHGASVEWNPTKNPPTIEVVRWVSEDSPKNRKAFKAEADVFGREIQAAGIVVGDPQFRLTCLFPGPIGSTRYRAVWVVETRIVQSEMIL